MFLILPYESGSPIRVTRMGYKKQVLSRRIPTKRFCTFLLEGFSLRGACFLLLCGGQKGCETCPLLLAEPHAGGGHSTGEEKINLHSHRGCWWRSNWNVANWQTVTFPRKVQASLAGEKKEFLPNCDCIFFLFPQLGVTVNCLDKFNLCRSGEISSYSGPNPCWHNYLLSCFCSRDWYSPFKLLFWTLMSYLRHLNKIIILNQKY